MPKKYFALMVLLFFVLFAGFSYAGKGGGGSSEPKYFTFEDLKKAAKDYKDGFSFYNYSMPSNAVASLPSQSPDGASSWVTALKIKSIRAKGWYWYLTFPWDDPKIKVGDIVFIRGGDFVSQVVKFFSTWTHTAMVYNKQYNLSLESQKENGVYTYDYRKAWKNIVAYSVKRADVYDPAGLMNTIFWRYREKSYFPPYTETFNGLSYFFRKWSNKYDMDSMYCSKLVWWTFKARGLNLDSERTSSLWFGKPEKMDDGRNTTNWNAWIGVSPDDIYASRSLSKDIVIEGQNQLGDPLSDSIF